MIGAASFEFAPPAHGAIGWKDEDRKAVGEFCVPIAAGALEFGGALALRDPLYVIEKTLSGSEGCRHSRDFFRIEGAEIVDQNIQRPAIADHVVGRENHRRAIRPG